MPHQPRKPFITEDSNSWVMKQWIREVSEYVEREGNVSTISAAYTVQNEFLIVADTSGGAFAVTLPFAQSNMGRKIIIKHKTGASNITITAQSGDSIDGAGTLVLNSAGNSVMLVGDGYSTWYRIRLP